MPEIALHILDLVQNSIRAGAGWIRILLTVSKAADVLRVEITDDGSGMSEEFAANVTDPFTTTRQTRRVGLGIPFFKAGCEAAGGGFALSSVLGQGTTISGYYQLSHIDRPPLGSYAETVHLILISNPEIRFTLSFESDNGSFELDTDEVRAILGDLPINTPNVSLWLKSYLEENMASLGINA